MYDNRGVYLTGGEGSAERVDYLDLFSNKWH